MASNYEGICNENRRRYGTEGAQKSGGLAAGLYDNATHFIFELLQNAEDALKRRDDWNGPRKVDFDLTQTRLKLSHFGKPFDKADVESVCDIAESTKDETSIGRFGLGFKSVYTVTDLPEIHSGEEDFAIEDYVFPKRLDRTAREADETQIILPLRSSDITAQEDIVAGLRHLGPSALLFLRHIDEINWSVAGGASGFYMRNGPELLGPNVQRVKVIGQESDHPEVDQHWLVFHRDVFSTEEKTAGRVEIAFALGAVKEAPGRWSVHPLATSPLVVFFPTVVETHLGFLVQGPYRTTPSRDNIPQGEEWNQRLVKETADLLVTAMRWMRDEAMLDVAALRCLPLDADKFPEGSRFKPVFDEVLKAFQNEELLPTVDGNYVTAHQARLARTQELRGLFNSEQVEALFDTKAVAWLSGEITQDKAPDIRQYLMRELDIVEIRPEKLIQGLTKKFLEAQSDAWVSRLYEFLSGQERAVRRHLDTIPLVRLDDGTHVVARENGKAKAFLPSGISTSFPTIRRGVCATHEVRAFLLSLGITEPDPVDDVIWHVLPKYQHDELVVDEESYAADMERIRSAFSTDSTAQKEKLRTVLRDTAFVMVVDTGSGECFVATPSETYLATDRLKQLFSGVPDVFIVDDAYDCLRGEEIRELLVSCGASRYLSLHPIASNLWPTEKTQIRKDAGLERATWEKPPEDFTIRGLTQLLDYLPKLSSNDAKIKAGLLWDSLTDLEARGTAGFYGSYKWGYFHETRTARFDASFVRSLNKLQWVPSNDGELARPALVLFDKLGWKPNQFLLTKLHFKPPIIDQLAQEAGIDPAALDLLRKYGITSVAELASRLGINTSTPIDEQESALGDHAVKESSEDVYGAAQDLYGDGMPEIQPGSYDPDENDRVLNGGGKGGTGPTGYEKSKGGNNSGDGASNSTSGNSDGAGTGTSVQGKRPPGHAGGRPFISYIGAHRTEEESDPNGLDQEVRMHIEEQAIKLIISLEPELHRTEVGNPGFDMYETNPSGELVRWIEVKAMTGSLTNRPVGLSHTQFECARVRGSDYWLYIVEFATDPANARVLRIQDPFGHASTFTFDKGWAEIAQAKSPASAN